MNFKGSILLVDDEAHIRKYVALILKQLGATKIVEATNGQEAIELFQQQKPDVVLLDISMPLMNGLETLKKLKAIDPEGVFIMLTSMVNRQSIDEALALGAANYIRKDNPKEEIAQAIKETLEERFP
jgi:two-component system, chemotaxis family, chemotaxis protein CheY